jgi:hypothetical protein
MQGTSRRSHNELLRALNNAADESFRDAFPEKIDEKNIIRLATRGSQKQESIPFW